MNLRHPRNPRLKKSGKPADLTFILRFSSLSGLFLVSFWSLSGLFQGLSGNKETEAVRRLRIGPE